MEHNDDWLDAESERKTHLYLDRASRNAWSGDWWEMPLLLLLVVVDVCGLFLQWRGVIIVLILTLVVVVWMLTRSGLAALVSFILGILVVLPLYVHLAYQTLG